MSDFNFDDLKPYCDSEINAAMLRIIQNPLFDAAAPFIYPNISLDQVKEMFRSIHTIFDFQQKVMHYAVEQIVNKSIRTFSFNGLEYLDKSKSYLFISNHRDILLDSALFERILFNNGFKTTEITFGSNLMKPDFVVDIGKSNKMFKVERGGNLRDLYHHSIHLSRYIRHTLKEKNESIWIAQRNGRTKDGNDCTDQGVLKMFSMSGDKNLLENLDELQIVPLSISYQYETCELMKVNELYQSKRVKYTKAPGEDLQSILTGIHQYKGDVHIEITQPITKEELLQIAGFEKNEFYNYLSQLIDSRIHKNYKLNDTNFIAFDIENGTKEYLNNGYSEDSRKLFESEMEVKLATLKGNIDELKQLYLNIYSNPVKNSFSSL